jgi:hypothetical protein
MVQLNLDERKYLLNLVRRDIRYKSVGWRMLELIEKLKGEE